HTWEPQPSLGWTPSLGLTWEQQPFLGWTWGQEPSLGLTWEQEHSLNSVQGLEPSLDSGRLSTTSTRNSEPLKSRTYLIKSATGDRNRSRH
uniref:Uncharacterized protein n=1 Tax=Sinocyclocheilus anshuiensis TaxID=1608454 RepID=A0A671RJX4_9TELE